MTYTLLTEPDLLTGSHILLQMIFDGESMSERLDEALKKFGEAHADEVRGYYNEAVQLEEYVRENLKIDDREKAEFLFKKREAVDNNPASVFYIYRAYSDKLPHGKLAAILTYAAEEFYIEKIKAGELPQVNNDGELFALFDSFTGDAAFKYDLMQLYYRFDEFNEYCQTLVNRVTRLVKDKLPLFDEKIKRFIEDMKTLLLPNGIKSFFAKFGVELDTEDIHIEISPDIYTVNTIRIQSFNAPDYNSFQMNVGVGFLALTELSEKLRPTAVLLPDFLKAMSDNTKWTIMQKLKKESMYSGQLAEQLNLTGATISHHMDTLKRLELIVYRKEGTKLYSEINKEMMKRYLDGLRKALIED